jgi:hypothetical protein
MTDHALCGKCSSPLSEDSGVCPQCSPARPVETVPLFLLLALIGTSALLIGSSFVNVASAPAVSTVKRVENLESSAYFTAREILGQRFPKAGNFSEFKHSPVQRNGNRFTVLIASDDGANARNFFRVDLEFTGGDWKVIDIKQ